MQRIAVTHFSDPGCPWAYSASPAFATLRWRYGDQLDWRLVLIGLTEQAQQYVDRGYTPLRSARSYRSFRARGMPFSTTPKEQDPALGDAAFRALQLAQFTTMLVLDDDADLERALEAVVGLDPHEIVARIDDPEVVAAYERDRAGARTAAGSPTELQGKAAATDGPVRYTAPSLLFERDGQVLEAGGFQPIEAYDVVIANLDPTLDRRDAPADPTEALEGEPLGLVTAEVAAIMRRRNDGPDPQTAEDALLEAVYRGDAVRYGIGNDALWLAARYADGDETRFRASSIAAVNGVVLPASARS